MNFLPKLRHFGLSTKNITSLVSCIRLSSSGITNDSGVVTTELTEHNDPDMFISDIKDPYESPEKICIACKYKIPFDYKNPRLLSQFISPYTGFIYKKHITGLCEAQQERLEKQIRLSRAQGYMPVQIKAPQYLKDPKLFDPFKPSRPNPH